MEDLSGIIIMGIIMWLIAAFIVGSFGKSREIGYINAFFASLFLTPILAMLFVIASKEKISLSIENINKDATYDYIDSNGNTRNVTIKTAEKAGWKLKPIIK